MQRILIQAAPCCQGNSKCLRKHGVRDAEFRTESNGFQGDMCRDENPLSEGHLRNASVLSRCAKSSSTDRLTCKHTGGSAASHTLTYMLLHLAEQERKREGPLMRVGGRSCSALGEREAQSASREEEKRRNALWLHWQHYFLIFARCSFPVFLEWFSLLWPTGV